MGASGLAFDFAIDAGSWDPTFAARVETGAMASGARAAGVRLDPVTPPFDDEMRALVLERVFEALAVKVPPLVRGIGGPAEFGLIVGCDEATPRFDVRTYFDKGDQPARAGWDAFTDEDHGMPFFLDPALEQERSTTARDALAGAPAAIERSAAAMAAWAAGLRDAARWSDARHTGTAAFADHAMRAGLADRRRSAARFLRAAHAALGIPGGELVRAAESYDYAAAAIEKGGTGPFDGSVALRFMDVGHRRGWANALETALRHEADARAAIVHAVR